MNTSNDAAEARKVTELTQSFWENYFSNNLSFMEGKSLEDKINLVAGFVDIVNMG